MAWSPYKNSIVNYVTRNPGCCKWDVAKYVTRDSRRCPSKQYFIVNTAIRNKWIMAVKKSNRYELYTPEEYAAYEAALHDYIEEYEQTPAWA